MGVIANCLYSNVHINLIFGVLFFDVKNERHGIVLGDIYGVSKDRKSVV